MPVAIISDPQFSFSAAHSGLHDGDFEPLHGRTYQAAVRVTGEPDEEGMVVDFTLIKTAMREAVAPLRRRVLLPRHPKTASVVVDEDQVHAASAGKRYSFPVDDVALLPVPNTTTEALAGLLLDRLIPVLKGQTGLCHAEIELAEAPDTSAVVGVNLREDGL